MSNTTLTYKQRMAELKCVVLMPTYNNAGTIAQVISDVKEFATDVIVVNDGSTDNTASILASIEGIKVIDYPNNKGKGYALKLGLRKAYEWGYRYAITIDSDERNTYKNGNVIDLTAREFDIVKLMMNNPGRVYSRENLLNLVWGADYSGDIRTVDVHMRRLREKLEDNPAQPEYVLTKWGVGYYFKA